MSRVGLALLVAAVLLPVTAGAETVADLIARGDVFDGQNKTREALAAYLEAEKLDPCACSHAPLLYRIAKEYSEGMNDNPSPKEKRMFGERSVDYAKRAVAADSKDPMAQLALAVCYGRLAPLADNKDKIEYSRLVKLHADASLALDPKNSLTYHVLGAWNYELANLNPLLRVLAKWIYGEIPAASNEEAVKNFKCAIAINPNRVGSYVELGKVYAAMSKTEEAKAILKKALAMPNRERDDPEEKRQGEAALKKL